MTTKKQTTKKQTTTKAKSATATPEVTTTVTLPETVTKLEAAIAAVDHKSGKKQRRTADDFTADVKANKRAEKLATKLVKAGAVVVQPGDDLAIPEFLDRSKDKPDETKAKSKAKTKAKSEPPTKKIGSGDSKPSMLAKFAAEAAAKGDGKTVTKSNGGGEKTRASYDWKGHEEASRTGTMPPKLDFSAGTHKQFRPKLALLEEAAAKRDVKALNAVEIVPYSSSPRAMVRWRDMCIAAIKASSKAAKVK